jgi:hypothetical protein
MDTKRCLHCHKLLRASAQVCNRCGQSAIGKKPGVGTQEITTPSVPPASSHRAGHYAGLHPEDQPYQSSQIRVLRPASVEAETRRPQQEPEYIVLPEVPGLSEPVKSLPPPSWFRRVFNRTRFPLRLSGKLPLPERMVSMILGLSCIFFLLASSIIAFVFIGKQPSIASASLVASPNELRINDTFTLAGNELAPDHLLSVVYDEQKPILTPDGKPLQVKTNDRGNFQIQLRVPTNWSAGQHRLSVINEAHSLSISTSITILQPSLEMPHLQLSSAQLHFKPEAPGVISFETLTLMNTGGGQISWQGSSDQPWLSVVPDSGTFFGRTNVQIKVNRASLAPKAYTGHILFTPNGEKAAVQALTVTTEVQSAPSALSVSTTALSYSAGSSWNPAAQFVTLRNSGPSPLGWHGSTTTGDGASWLSLSPTSGRLEPGASVQVAVSVSSLQLAVGSYQGTVDFTGGAKAQITVTLNVFAPGNLIVSPAALNLSTVTGQGTISKSLVLQNSGGLTLDWTASASTVDGGKWVSVTPAGGTLYADAQADVTVTIDSGALKAGSYRGTLTFTAGSQAKTVALSLSVTEPPAPLISVSLSSLSFTTLKGENPAAQTFTLSNTGNTSLTWGTTVSDANSNWLKVTPAQGSLPAGESARLTVNPTVSTAAVGELRATLTIGDRTPGSKVVSRTVTVSVTITERETLTVSPLEINFTSSPEEMSTSQSLVINNTTERDLHWEIVQTGNTQPWLTFERTEGDLPSGNATIINIYSDSLNLFAGKYVATLQVRPSDSAIAPQTVNVVLIVEK